MRQTVRNRTLQWGRLPITHVLSLDVKIGLVFPTSTTGTEFIGEIVAPIAIKWAGIALGGAMIGNPLLVAWPNGNTIVTSTRWATFVHEFVWTQATVLTDMPSLGITRCRQRTQAL